MFLTAVVWGLLGLADAARQMDTRAAATASCRGKAQVNLFMALSSSERISERSNAACKITLARGGQTLRVPACGQNASQLLDTDLLELRTLELVRRYSGGDVRVNLFLMGSKECREFGSTKSPAEAGLELRTAERIRPWQRFAELWEERQELQLSWDARGCALRE